MAGPRERRTTRASLKEASAERARVQRTTPSRLPWASLDCRAATSPWAASCTQHQPRADAAILRVDARGAKGCRPLPRSYGATCHREMRHGAAAALRRAAHEVWLTSLCLSVSASGLAAHMHHHNHAYICCVVDKVGTVLISRGRYHYMLWTLPLQAPPPYLPHRGLVIKLGCGCEKKQ